MHQIQGVLVSQITVLETMSPTDEERVRLQERRGGERPSCFFPDLWDLRTHLGMPAV